MGPTDAGTGSQSTDGVPPLRLLAQADLTEQLNHIKRKRQDLQEALRALDAEEVRLRKLWNSFLPVNQLPNELLVKIFQLSAKHDWVYNCRLRGDMIWVRLMLVCSYWREVACATPTLWRTIGISGDAPDWLDLCVARSAETNLRIQFSTPSAGMIQRVAPLSERIETISIREPTDPPSLSQLLSQRLMPILHDLTVSIKKNQTTVDLEIPPTHYPTLSSLQLSRVRVPSDFNLFASLRTLSLCEGGYGSCPSLSQFLDALRASPHLESLTITNVLEGLRDRHSVLSALPVVLPHLSTFYLSNNHPSYAPPFLTHLRIPPTCTTTIFATPHTEDFVLTPLELTIAELIPENSAEVLPVLASVTTVEVEMTWGDYALRGVPAGSDGFRGTILLGLVAEDQPVEDWDWSCNLSLGLREAAQVFEGAQVTRVRVKGDHGSSYLPEAWREVFQAFPLLETLEITGSGAPSRMWTGLRMAGPNIVQQLGGGLPATACPSLRTVSVDGREMLVSKRFFEELLACLRHRARQGARLESLHLKLSPDQAHFDKLRDRYWAQVEELVGSISYDFYG
ncbi:hypothetical protein C8T65DRAFT_286394 [Cerioporus squamosus]|nr:hypothetical protein C8T65DRAFT_286394 [Cerioporus squamosus]